MEITEIKTLIAEVEKHIAEVVAEVESVGVQVRNIVLDRIDTTTHSSFSPQVKPSVHLNVEL